MAATLQAHIGDVVSLTARPGARPDRFRVSGVALITAPDIVFQPLNPLLGPAPAQPPANAAILPIATLAATLARHELAIRSGAGGASAVPGAQTGVQWQVSAQVDPSGLGSTPREAFTRAGAIVHRVEAALPGQVAFVDNLSDALNTAAGDALYAETLYIMLAVPGALIALGGLIWWLTAKTGFSAIVNPDSNPSLSLSVYMFFGPALLWIGAALLLVRLRGGALALVAGRFGGGPPRTTGAFLLASASRR